MLQQKTMRLLQWVYVHYILKYFKDLFALQWSNGSVARAAPSRREPSHSNSTVPSSQIRNYSSQAQARQQVEAKPCQMDF
jgi:hypothetical protein